MGVDKYLNSIQKFNYIIIPIICITRDLLIRIITVIIMEENKASEINQLKKKIRELEKSIKGVTNGYYYSKNANKKWNNINEIPKNGNSPNTVKEIIENNRILDFDQRLNTSSYVNVNFEKEEEEIAIMGMKVNLADQTVYPQSYKMHDNVVNMIAHLWNCPEPNDMEEHKVFAGAGTVGSTEACLLAGLALKFRWRKWYTERHSINMEINEDSEKLLGVRPNIVISSCYQAAWEKLFKYMDIEPKIIQPSSKDFKLDPEKVREKIDDKTIGVVCILGNHYGGQYDPVWKINEIVKEVNQANDFQVGIHVDAASGGFIAPFQKGLPDWDFRLSNVLSISTSGHKYGESCCGTGWVIWRQRENLSEYVTTSVTYLGGKGDSYTLNFSRPASGVYIQYYKLLRYGMTGYQQCCDNLMLNAKYIREKLKEITWKGIPRFIFLDDGDKHCLPVITARLNPKCEFVYDDIDLQHVLSMHLWYVSGYKMGYNHPISEKTLPLFNNEDSETTMFRIVIKNNITRDMAIHLVDSFRESFDFLDSVDFSKLHGFDFKKLRHKDQRKASTHC